MGPNNFFDLKACSRDRCDGCDLCSGGRHCGRQGQFGGTVLQSEDTVCTGGYYYQSTVELFFVYFEESEDESISEVFELKHEFLN